MEVFMVYGTVGRHRHVAVPTCPRSWERGLCKLLGKGKWVCRYLGQQPVTAPYRVGCEGAGWTPMSSQR